MNVQAAAVERLAASPIMSRFHGVRSVAVLLGSLIGAACVSADVDLAAQLTVIGAMVIVVVLPLSRGLPSDPAPTAGKRTERPPRIWRSPTVMILSAVAFASFCVKDPHPTGRASILAASSARRLPWPRSATCHSLW